MSDLIEKMKAFLRDNMGLQAHTPGEDGCTIGDPLEYVVVQIGDQARVGALWKRPFANYNRLDNHWYAEIATSRQERDYCEEAVEVGDESYFYFGCDVEGEDAPTYLAGAARDMANVMAKKPSPCLC